MKTIRLAVLCFGIVVIITGCQHNIAHDDIDLDTTYFPFGLGYEWCYENHNWHSFPDDENNWNKYDTFKIEVTDSSQIADTLFFTGGATLELDNPIKIWELKVPLGNPDFHYDTIPITVAQNMTWQNQYGLQISYFEDKLSLDHYYGECPEDEGWNGVRRLKGIGVILQGYNFSTNEGNGGSSGSIDRLLWFYNGKDTVYKAQ